MFKAAKILFTIGKTANLFGLILGAVGFVTCIVITVASAVVGVSVEGLWDFIEDLIRWLPSYFIVIIAGGVMLAFMAGYFLYAVFQIVALVFAEKGYEEMRARSPYVRPIVFLFTASVLGLNLFYLLSASFSIPLLRRNRKALAERKKDPPGTDGGNE